MSAHTPEHSDGIPSADLPPAEPTILFDYHGALAVQLPTEVDLATYLTTDLKVAPALAACGISPELAVGLLVQAPSSLIVFEEDHFSEHIRVREFHGAVRVLDIDFFPAAANGSPTIGGIFVRDAEIILGKHGLGILEVVPVAPDGGQFVMAGESVKVHITEHTLVILPPEVQGNRWEYFAPSDGETPSLTAIYIAYPGPFETAKVAPLLPKTTS